MNDFFIYLILFLVFALFDFIAKRRKQAQRRGPQPGQPQLPAEPTPVTKPDDELEEALRQIGEALGMPVPKKKPEPKPLPQAQEERDFHGQVIVREPKSQPDFHEQGFEDRPPYRNRPAPREEAFEQRPPYKNRPTPQEDAFESRPQEAFASWEQAFEDRPTPFRAPTLPVPATPRVVVAKRTSPPISVPPTPSVSDTSSLMHDDLQGLLRDPHQARQAFLLSEVFGPPKSQRR